MNRDGDNLHLLHKTPGSLHLAYVSCGKPRCRCADGRRLHGPYTFHHFRIGGRQFKQYVRAQDAGVVRAAITTWRAAHPPARTMRDTLTRVRRLALEVTNA